MYEPSVLCFHDRIGVDGVEVQAPEVQLRQAPCPAQRHVSHAGREELLIQQDVHLTIEGGALHAMRGDGVRW